MGILKKVFYFYYDGFRSMTLGKKLWAIILIKLFVFFVILKLFFFKDYLKTNFSTEEQRQDYILDELSK